MQSRLKAKPFAMIFGLALVLILLPLVLNLGTKAADEEVASPYSEKSFIKEVAPLAQKLSDSYGVKASLLIAQAAESSHYGRSLLAAKYHNYMGLVANPGEAKIVLTGRTYESGRWERIKQPYAVYRSWTDSFYAYLEALSSGTWGQDLYTKLATAENNQTALRLLQDSGISTDPEYSQKLGQIIQKHNLTQYDK